MNKIYVSATSDFLSDIGLGGLDIGYIFVGLVSMELILLVMCIVLFVKTGNLKKRLDKFTTGKNGKSLEKDIVGLYEDNKFLKANVERNKKEIRTLFKNMESTFQKIGVVKYDAFRQMGGQLSFCLALLNEKNDGFIINSVHSTEGCYSYTKVIKNGECDISLGEEEKKALQMAIGE